MTLEGIRLVVAVALATIALFLLGGPALAAAGAVDGQDVHIEGGVFRLLFDVAFGLVALRASARSWTRSREPITSG